MTEEEYQALYKKMQRPQARELAKDMIKNGYTIDEIVKFPKKTDSFIDNIENAACWLSEALLIYLKYYLNQPHKAFQLNMLFGYIGLLVGESLYHDGKEDYEDYQIDKDCSLLEQLEAIKYDLDKRIEEIKKLKIQDNSCDKK